MSGPTPAIGRDLARVDGRDKVTGAARYAVEHHPDGAVHLVPVLSTVARGRVVEVDVAPVEAVPGVLAVLHHANAPRLGEVADAELAVLQSPRVAYRGQVVAGVVATTLEVAQDAAAALRITYAPEGHDVALVPGHAEEYEPEAVNGGVPGLVARGDVEAGLDRADVVVDRRYSTPPEHNNPMEPHAATARWDGDRLHVHSSAQAPSGEATTLARLFGVATGAVRVEAQHVGGGFGAKGTLRPVTVLTVMAARLTGLPVRCALPRRALFSTVGYRTPTVSRVRLGARRDGTLTAIDHEAWSQTSRLMEFVEQTGAATNHLWAAPERRVRHHVTPLDVHTPRWFRAPGEAPGVWALESAMDELAVALDLDPVELRRRNEPDVDPTSGEPFSSRGVLACLEEGARRFDWDRRDPTPGVRRDGRRLLGTGVAVGTYPVYVAPSTAAARVTADGRFEVEVAASDIGTGARTALGQIAADALGVEPDDVTLRIADSDIGRAPGAGGSMGTASWGWAVHEACCELQARLADGPAPADGLEVRADTRDQVAARRPLSRHAFSAQFATVAVDVDSGEVAVERLLGVFAVGRVVNPRTARSQLLGGMVMGISMALHEEGVVDPTFGHTLNADLADYHVAVNADVRDVEAVWIDERDDELNPMGSKGIGEIGIVGTAAAVANAVHHATGVRLRDLPLRPDRVLEGLEALRA